MDLRSELLREYNKSHVLQIVHWIGTDQDRFDQLVDLLIHGEKVESQRAAWVFHHSAEAHPELVRPHFKSLLDHLRPPVSDSVKRGILRALGQQELPEAFMGIAADYCFDFLPDPKETIAVRVYAMNILWNICQKEPDLSEELALLIEDQLPYWSAGLKSRGKKILKWIKDMKKSK